MRLSICIPTHHGRGEFLREAISSVLPQITQDLRGQVEICISDNASEDETQSLVEQYSCDYPGLFVYHRNPINLGFTRNLIELINIAQGDYCWLFSSDDVMDEQGLSQVLNALEQHPTLVGITVDFHSYDKTLTRLVSESHPPSLLPAHPEQKQIFTSPEQIFRNCGSVQGNVSMQIFDRRLWQETMAEISPAKFTCFHYFPYLYLFGKMVKKRPEWMWLPERLIRSRTENDYLSAHLSRNMLRYHTLTMEEVSQVWGELFGRSSGTYQSLMRDNYLNFWSAYPLLVYKARYSCTIIDELRALVWFTRRLFFLPSFWLTTLPVLLTSRFIPQFALALLRLTGLGQVLRLGKRLLGRAAKHGEISGVSEAS